MTYAGSWGRRGKARDAAASEAFHAVRSGIAHVWRLSGLSVWQRFLIACLKVVAIAGYHYGKWVAAATGAAGSREKQSTERDELVDAAVSEALMSRAATAHGGDGSTPAQARRPLTLSGRPLLAVIMPVFAPDETHLVRMLAALDRLSRQTRQSDYLVLIDDGSPCPIPSIISGLRVLVVRLEANCGPAAARNAGLAAARRLGVQLVAFLDADCLPEPSWLGVMERAQRRRPGIVAGRTMASMPSTPVGLYHNVCGTLNGRRLVDGSMLYGCTCNLSIDLARVQHDFDASFTKAAFEDVEFCVRARKAGVPVTYDPDAVVRHHYDHSWLGLFRQFSRYGRFEGHMCRRHPEYLTWLWSSADVSCLSSLGMPLKPVRHDPPPDSALVQTAEPGERSEYESRGPLLGALATAAGPAS